MSFVVRPFNAGQAVFDAFLAEEKVQPHVTFLNTWQWGEHIAEEAREFQRFGIYDDEQLVAVGHAVRQPLKIGGSFWYSPRGLVLDYSNTALVGQAYRALEAYFASQHGAFLRVDPDVVRGDAAEAAIDELGPGQAAIFTQAERVWCIDIQPDEATQLEWMKSHGMRKNIPYYLRRAANADVVVRASDDPADLEKLIVTLNQLNERKGGIGKHRDDHYRRQFAKLAPAGQEKVFLAEKDGQVLAGALITLYGREASYLHGASSDIMRELSAPHYLHLEIINYCRQHYPSITRYNMWGIVGDKNRKPSHPRHGYSEFKRSFGGYKETYIRARDFRYNWLVWKLDWYVSKYRAWKHKND